ncbi:MAG: sugar ABC transporter ATP-binding protein [Acidimicrobiales bacterium]
MMFDPGRVHALIGANGAGKSTLLGIIAGRLAPSSGQVFVDGRELPYGRPRAVARSSVAAIYQELAIVPAMSARENVFLGSKASMRTTRRRYRELCKLVGGQIQPESQAGSLSVPDQQLLEIMRCLDRDARVVLLDEPTSALAEAERQKLFKLMRELKGHGRTLIFVSHELDEVLEIADRICVFRNGHLVADKPVSDWTKSTLIQAMLGDTYVRYAEGNASAVRATSGRDTHDVAVEIRTLRVRRSSPAISFSIGACQIVGIAGLAGSGRSSLIRALAGDGRDASGSVVIDGTSHPIPRSPWSARRLGIGLVPEDRKRAGLVMAMTSRENVALPRYASFRGQFDLRGLGRRANAAARSVGLMESLLDRPASALSGGNQQKLMLARWVEGGIRLLVADEPTRGVDVGAKLEVLATLRSLADQGLAVLVVSSELEDLEQVCDRVLVLRKGQIVAELGGGTDEVSVDAMLALSFG